MKISTLKATLKARFEAGIQRPIHIEGAPGGGKTQAVQQLAAEMGIGFKMVHPPTMREEDYGMPLPNAKKTGINFIVPNTKFPLEGDAGCPDRGVLCIDELSQGDTGGQKILANIVQERTIHDYRLKSGWMIVSTGNRPKDRAGANRLLSHLDGRITTVELAVDVDEWALWYMSRPDCKIEVVSFIRFRPELLMAFDPQQTKSPSPRNWVEGVGADLGVVPPVAEFECFSGSVGVGAAGEFVGFLRVFRSLPDPDMVLMDPQGAEVPTSPAAQYALVGALAARTTRNNFGRGMAYMARMPGELSVLYVPGAVSRDAGIVNTREYIEWATGRGADVLLGAQ